MSGTAIITELLVADPWFKDLADNGRLKEDLLPENAVLTAVMLSTVSGNDRQPLTTGDFIRSVERIAVTVRAASVRDRKAAIARARDACKGVMGSIAGCRRVSVLTAGLGPSLIGRGNSFEQTQDFRVSFDAPA